jgi:cytoskeleton protein RodZ
MLLSWVPLDLTPGASELPPTDTNPLRSTRIPITSHAIAAISYTWRAVIDLGTSLAAARETRGWSLADAERLTNIRVRHLAALERGDYDALPGRAYARAFLRTYATALDLDANQLVARFEELVPVDDVEELPPPRRELPLRKLATVGVVAGVLAVVAWAGTSSHPNRTTPPAQAASPAAAPVVQEPPPPTTTVAAPSHSSALVVSATRGRCWLLVRAGGTATGQVLFEGVLEQGQSKRFSEAKVWIRFGAPSAVDVRRGATAVGGISGLSPLDVIA